MTNDIECGYGNPPVASRFPKGVSGNPKGRPRGRRNRPPYDAVLGQLVTIKQDGVERRATAAEAFLLYMMKRGLEGDSSASRAMMEAIAEVRATRMPYSNEPVTLVMVPVYPGSVTSALETLRIGRKLDRFRPSIRVMLEPWLVQAALASFRGAAAFARGAGDGHRSDPDTAQGAMARLVGSQTVRFSVPTGGLG